MQINIDVLSKDRLAKIRKDADRIINVPITDFEWDRCIARFRLITSKRDITIDDVVGHLLTQNLESDKN